MLTPHPYQADMIERARREVGRGRRKVLVVAPTGSGKTVVAGLILAGVIDKGKKAVFLAHRRELIKQASVRLWDAGIDGGCILPGFPSRPDQAVQIASVQSFDARVLRAGSLELPEADVVVVDEAHHARAATYASILAKYPDAVVLGLTATPCRADGRGLGNVFDVIVEGPSTRWLTDNGFLVPAICYAPTRPDLEGVRVRHGDYAENDLADRMDRPALVGDVITHWHRLGQGRPTVVFATSVAHSQHLAEEFEKSGVVAAHLDGTTPIETRDRILERLAAGDINVVSNCAVLTEGWDSPAVSCCVLARPTKSLGLYRQMIGRVFRTHPGKTDAIIIDHAGGIFEHGLPADDTAWELSTDKRAANRSQAARSTGEHGQRQLVDCKECGAVRMQGDACPACGYLPKRRGEQVDFEDGDLAEVVSRKVGKTEPSAAEKAQFYGELIWIGRERGYKDGWAYHTFVDKFGHRPRGDSAVREPRAETRSWVRSRLIRHAKGSQKQHADALL